MHPLVKKGQTVQYTIGRNTQTAKAFRSNPKCVWIELDTGKIIRLHKKAHKIKIVENPVEEKEVTSTRGKTLDDLFKTLKDRSSP